jgi:prepilin-type N-terminal cleavage/methylation domain-containing protein
MGRAGFTHLELMIVASIIGLLTVLAVPSLMSARMRGQDEAFLSDLRVITDSGLELYSFDHGDYPPEAAAGSMPSGLADYMPARIKWEQPTPIGGVWDWDRAPDRAATVHGAYAGLSVVNPRRTSLQMATIDAKIDDGNIETGRFRRRDGGYIYVLK